MKDKWTGASVASKFKHQVFYFLIRIGGRFLSYTFLYFVVFFYTCIPHFRRKAYYYLDKRFQDKSFIKKYLHCYKLFLTFGKVLVDRAIYGITGKIDILSSQEDKELCKKLYEKGKGLIIITAHCGCWQSAMAGFDFIKAPKYVLYKRVKEDVDKQVFEHGKKKQNINFIDPSLPYGGTIEILNVLEKKSILCMMGDREFGSDKNKIKVSFLGKDIFVPATIYRIAAITKAPIMIVFFPFMGNGKFGSKIMEVFEVEDKGLKISNYKHYAQKFINNLENFVEQYPYQFFNLYNMWEEQ